MSVIKKVSKGRRWMPWLSEAMKDVISCEITFDPKISEWGNPAGRRPVIP